MHAARILERCARAGDVLGRIGGDEFALLLPETSAEQALPIAERWAKELRAAPVGVAAHLTMSAGVSDLTHANGSRELFRLADAALYWAKSQGRDTTVVYSPDTVYEFSDSDRVDRMARMQSLAAIRSLARMIDAKDSPERRAFRASRDLRAPVGRGGRLGAGARCAARRGGADPRRREDLCAAGGSSEAGVR